MDPKSQVSWEPFWGATLPNKLCCPALTLPDTYRALPATLVSHCLRNSFRLWSSHHCLHPAFACSDKSARHASYWIHIWLSIACKILIIHCLRTQCHCLVRVIAWWLMTLAPTDTCAWRSSNLSRDRVSTRKAPRPKYDWGWHFEYSLMGARTTSFQKDLEHRNACVGLAGNGKPELQATAKRSRFSG